jgi:hypothetical protein
MRVARSRRTRFARALPTVLLGVSALLIGCHGNHFAPPGTPVVTIGENINSGDFAGYIVAIDSITLTESNGSIVTLLGTPQTVDLARLTNLSELLEAPALPSGTYTSASLIVDYSAASIWVNINGQAVAATVLNASGTSPTSLAINVTFDPSHPLVITQGQSTRLHIDLDLAAINSINSAVSPPTVTVQPFAVITPAPVDATLMRARGLYVTTQSAGFIMNLRPFYDLLSAIGAVTVNTGAQTYFNINGVVYTGAAGLSAMAGLSQNIPIAAYGTLDNLSTITPSFNATTIYAGSSLESPLSEYVSGVVASRSGNTLQVLGATYRSPTGSVLFLSSLPVVLGSGTLVTEDGVAAQGLSSTSVSVGQQITVAGQAHLNASTGAITELDATGGLVRLASTRLWGTLNSAIKGSASLDLLSIGSFASSAFNFAGTGGQNATAAAYAVNTGSLDESAVPAGTLLQVDGIVTPFGSAPPDFSATAITPGASTPQQLVIEWVNGGATAPFTSVSSAGLVVNLANANLGTVHYIRTGPVTIPPATIDLTGLPRSPPLTITTVGAPQSDLQLAVGSTALASGVSVFSSAAPFTTALVSAFNGTNKIYRLVAVGQYDSGNNTFVASRIHVALHE